MNDNNKLAASKKLQYFTLFITISFVLYTAVFGLLYPVCGDDFAHSTIAREGKVLSYSIYLYKYWTLRLGNILSVLVLYLDKSIFDFINPFVQLALPLSSFFLLFNRLPRLKRAEDCISFLSLLLLFWVGCARPRDTVYWVSGATVYSWGMLIVLLFFCFLRRLLTLKDQKISYTILKSGGLMLLGICAGFCNENNTLIGIMIITGALFFCKVKKIKVNQVFYYGIAGFYVGAVLLLSAPGIWLRKSSASDILFWDIQTKIMLVPSVISFCLYASYISCVMILLASPLLLYKIHLNGRGKLSFWSHLYIDRQIFIALILISISLLLALVFAGTGLLPAVRAYYSSSVCMAMAAVLLIDSLFRKYHDKKMVFTIITLLCCYSAFILFDGAQDFASINREQNTRNIEIARQKQAGARDLLVSQHRTVRKKLFQFIWIEDIVTDKDFWLNKRAAKFYQVNSIRCRNEFKHSVFFWGYPKNNNK